MRDSVRIGVMLVAVPALGCAATARGDGHLMRYADIHDDTIVFTYEGDLWLVPADGGDARRITNDPGSETTAKFSPDGTMLAFTAQYDGGTDVYVMDARGGAPKRLTFHPARDVVVDWFPDGKHVLFRSRREYSPRLEEIYKVSIDGGMPVKLPVDRAALSAVSPDGRRIAFNRIGRENRTWKRHHGGTAQDIWLGSLDRQDYEKITDWAGSDNFPMWYGGTLCFNSDRRFGTMNLYKMDPATRKATPLTEYKDYDVKNPSIGGNRIVYQYAERLRVLDLDTGQTRLVPVEIHSDLVRMRPEYVSVSPSAGSFSLSPSGTRMLLEARGEILNVPVEDGETVNLTNTTDSREKNAVWSPDGRWVAFISDKTGEEEFYLVDQKGEQPWRQLTVSSRGFRMQPVWSPDSRYLLYSDKFMVLQMLDVEAGTCEALDGADYDDGWERWGIQDYVWSPDSRWIAYTKLEQSGYESIFLFSLDAREKYRLTSRMTQDWSPSFDPAGKYLYFLSNRTFSPIMGAVDQNHVFLDMARPYVVVLAADEPSPFAPKDSKEPYEENGEDETDGANDAEIADRGDAEGAANDEGEEADAGQADKTDIDIEGIQRRIVAAPGVDAGNYFRLEGAKGGFLYVSKPAPEFLKYQNVNDNTSGKLDLYHYDLEEQKTKNVLPAIANYHPSADGKKLVYRSGSSYGVVDVGKEAKVGDGKVDLDDARVKVDRSREFLQIYDEGWRVQRDWFYDQGMHGEDWEAVRAKYRKFVPYCGNRSDLNYLIGEMIAELNAGHTYVRGGDIESKAKQVRTGMLGAEFAANGAPYYRIAHIIPGTPGNDDERSPLDTVGCPIAAGDYLIAIDGQEVRTDDNVYRHLQNKSSKVVTLTYNDQPTPDGAKTYRVRTIGSEEPIRYRAWVEKNRALVERASDGKLGYLHIPDMGQKGLVEFARGYYPQFYKQGLVIDERYNGGGFTSDMIIDRLERVVWAATQPREGKPLPNPERGFQGHLVVIVNEETASCGEFFAETVKLRQLAPVLGVRTWGGSVGVEPHQHLVDGGTVTPPQFGLYGLNRTWLIEGHGVVPDIEVQNMPGDVVRGKDAQLEAAVEYLLKRAEEAQVGLPQPPEYPVKTK